MSCPMRNITILTQWCIPLPTATHISLTLHQQAADELGRHLFCGEYLHEERLAISKQGQSPLLATPTRKKT